MPFWGSAKEEPPKRTCFYVVLGVDREATEKQIKKGYHKAALKWHPDKNADNMEVATEKFKEVQEAYEVLSNPDERAWYDSHRDQVLNGGSGGDGGGFEDVDIASLYRSSFSGFGDDQNGYFAVFGEVFAGLDKLEKAFDAAPKEAPAPSFGNSMAPDRIFDRFYSFWCNFASRRSFSFKDKWRLSDAPNRNIKRMMERDNKKARDVARKEYSEQVRDLAKWAKKKDPRQAEKKKRKILADVRRAKEEAELKEKSERERKAARAEHMQQEILRREEQVRLRKKIYGDILSSEEEEKDEKVISCVICSKNFKSEKQFSNHEKSKKHKQAVAKFRKESERAMGKARGRGAAEKGALEKEKQNLTLAKTFECVLCCEIFANKKKLQQHRRSPQHILAEQEAAEDTSDSSLGAEGLGAEAHATEGSNAAEHASKDTPSTLEEVSRTLEASPEAENSDADGDISPEEGESEKAQSAAVVKELASPRRSKGKKPRRRRAKKAKEAQGGEAAVSDGDDEDDTASKLRCDVCKNVFTSRTKLFTHIKEKGHATLKNAFR